MRLHNLKGLRTLMVVRNVSQRRLALAAGYRSHAYMGRILRGEVETLEAQAAVLIARFLQVDIDFLFAPRVSGRTAHSDHQRRTAGAARQGSGRRTSRTRGRTATSGPTTAATRADDRVPTHQLEGRDR
jgi:transcriptional regulator with XRE-family HTH domain